MLAPVKGASPLVGTRSCKIESALGNLVRAHAAGAGSIGDYILHFPQR
jgi:hypothetical protein